MGEAKKKKKRMASLANTSCKEKKKVETKNTKGKTALERRKRGITDL